MNPEELDTRDVLARTLWGEARNQGQDGMRAVAAVILNRAAKPGWWGHDVKSVCLKNRQFSAWNFDDPNRDKMLALTEADAAYRQCLEIADEALGGKLVDPTGGATHYHTKAVKPYWAKAETPCCTIGDHVFYKEPDK